MALSFDPISGLPTTKKAKATTFAAPKFSSPIYAMNADPGGAGGKVTDYGGIHLGPTFPNYKDLIESDPTFLQATGELTKQGIQSAAQRALARQRALIQFGAIPDFGKAGMDLGLVGGDIQGDITPETIAAAAANNEAGLSTSARMGSAHSKAVRDIQNALTARGLARSGETGYQLDEENQNYAIGQNDATSKLLDYLAGVQAAFTQGEADRANAKNVAAGQASQTQATLNPGIGPQELSWNLSENAWGPDAQGNFYIPAPDWTKENGHYVQRPKKTSEPAPTPTPMPTGTAISSTPPPGWISDYSVPAPQATVKPPTGALNMPGGVANTWNQSTTAPATSMNDLWRLLRG